jgi:hypothetical protein
MVGPRVRRARAALADRLLVEAALAPLRADPRFPQLARRLGLDATGVMPLRRALVINPSLPR